MTLVWVGVLLFAFSWLRAVPIFAGAGGGGAWFLTGVAAVVFGLRNTALWDEDGGKTRQAALLVCSIVGLTWLDGPFRWGFVLLAFACAIALSPLPRGIRRWITPGLFVSGAVYSIHPVAGRPPVRSFEAHQSGNGVERFHAVSLLHVGHDSSNPDLGEAGAHTRYAFYGRGGDRDDDASRVA
jgi:hypothetical protein